MTWDDKAPERLRDLQNWFGSVIGTPLLPGSKIRQLSPRGDAISEEAQRYILPSPTLAAWQRIELYNQQYWWRLLDAYQENFPLTLRLFGPEDFNGLLAIPCLAAQRPDHWSLGQMGAQLVDHIDRNYHEGDRALVLDAARLDLAYLRAFIAPSAPALSLDDGSDLDLYLQAHVFLFKLNANLFEFRDALIKETSDYWLTHDFPKMQPGEHFILFQSPEKRLEWQPLMAAEYFLLESLKSGKSLGKACEELEVTDDNLCKEALENLHLWCRKWTLHDWLTREPAKQPS